jgi:hypothetical protein
MVADIGERNNEKRINNGSRLRSREASAMQRHAAGTKESRWKIFN